MGFRKASRETSGCSAVLAAGWLGFAVFATPASGQGIDWLRQFGTSSVDQALGVTKDSTGVYVAGFSDGTLPGQTSVRFDDAFVRKYDAAGTELWTRQFGTLGGDRALSVAVDATGIYVAGWTFGVFPGQTDEAGGDAFLRKYDGNGTELWTRQFGTQGTDEAFAVAAGTTGVYVVGRTTGVLAGETAGGRDAFVRKYDANGVEQWTRQFGTLGDDQAWAVAVDSSGIYVTGYTTGALAGQNAGGFDGFVRKYDSSGAEQWTRQFGTESDDGGQAVTANSGVYVAGIIGIGGALPGQTSAGARDAFVRKYSVSGTEEWTRQFGTTGNDQALGVFADPVTVYVAGNASFALPGLPTSTVGHAFVRKYGANGTEQETQQFGSGGSDFANAVIADSAGVFTVGHTNGAIPGQTFLGGFDAFAAKLTFSTPPVEISLRQQSFRFSGFLGGGVQQQTLQIGVTGGSLSWRARVTILNGVGWLAVAPPNGTAAAGLPSRLRLDVNFAAFAAPGTYQAEIAIEKTDGTVLARLPVTVVVSAVGSRLLLSQSAFVFRTVVGGAARLQTLRIVNGGQGSLDWTIPAPASLTAPLTWLAISNLSGSANAGGSSTTTLSVNSAGLAAGVYQVVVPVSAPGAANHPQLLTVTLHVVPVTAPVLPELSTHGILFIVRTGNEAPTFDFFVGNGGGGAGGFSLQTSTESAINWLSVLPSSGSIGTQTSFVQTRLNLLALPLGTYRGRITATFTPGGTREIDVVLIFTAPPVATARNGPVAAQCAGGTMEMVVTSVGSGSVEQVTFPRTLRAEVADSCGNRLSDATVLATVDGRLIALESLGEGVYSAIWTPEREAASVPITFAAVHPNYNQVERTVTISTVRAVGGVLLPVLAFEGVVEGAAFTPRRPLAPGGIVSLFGSNFATTTVPATRLPLDRNLGGARVQIGAEDVPLYFAGPGQINAQVPYSARPGESVSIAVNVNGRATAPQTYEIAPVQPSVFLAGEGGAILDGQSRLVNAANPARRGDVLQIFATGLGETNPPGKTGEGAPGFSQVLLPVTVTVGGVEAAVVYQGLAPGFAGLYQVNAVVPTSVTPGNNVPVVIRQNGISSNPERPATIPVR